MWFIEASFYFYKEYSNINKCLDNKTGKFLNSLMLSPRLIACKLNLKVNQR
jgi:hypothetical protein